MRKSFEVLGNLASRVEPEVHPLLVKREKISKVELLHFTADRGLCGSFNVNSINRASKWIKEQNAAGKEPILTLVGKKGRDFFRRGKYNIRESFTGLYGTVDISLVNKITTALIQRYLAGEADEVYMIYSRFVGMAKQEPTWSTHH
jgi:F-type H+-transporting ATPase subunit gamma